MKEMLKLEIFGLANAMFALKFIKRCKLNDSNMFNFTVLLN